MKLNKKEQNAVDFLYEFAKNLKEGKPTVYSSTTVNHLSDMGIHINFVSHKEVSETVRGKGEPFEWFITNAPWYIRG